MDARITVGSTPAKSRSWWIRPSPLGIVFVVLVSISLGKQVIDAWPHPPRVVVENRCPDTIQHLIVEGPSGTTDLGSLPPRGRVPVGMEFRPGETYVIQGHEASGDEVVRQLEFARKEGRDVVISIRWNLEGYVEVYFGGYLPLADPGRETRR